MNEYFSGNPLDTAPAQLNAILQRQLRCRITLKSECGGLCLGSLYRLAVDAVPAVYRNTILLSFLFRGVTLASLFLTLGPGDLDHFAVHATPPARFAIPDCLFLSGEARRSGFLRVRFGRFHDLSIGTSPADFRFTAFLCFSRRVVTLEAFRLAIDPSRLDHILIKTVPVRPAALDRFFRSLVALTSVRFTLGLRADVDHTFETAIAPTRRRRIVMTTAIIGTGQRPVPAMRRFRGTGRMISGRPVPLVGMRIRFPRPAASVLLPDPLTTGIAPAPAIDRRRSHQEGVLIAIESDAFAHYQRTIVDRLCHRQHFEVTKG